MSSLVSVSPEFFKNKSLAIRDGMTFAPIVSLRELGVVAVVPLGGGSDPRDKAGFSWDVGYGLQLGRQRLEREVVFRSFSALANGSSLRLVIKPDTSILDRPDADFQYLAQQMEDYELDPANVIICGPGVVGLSAPSAMLEYYRGKGCRFCATSVMEKAMMLTLHRVVRPGLMAFTPAQIREEWDPAGEAAKLDIIPVAVDVKSEADCRACWERGVSVQTGEWLSWGHLTEVFEMFRKEREA